MASGRRGKIDALLDHPNLVGGEIERWADLGCGDGAFTVALAGRLAAGSLIHAVDTDGAALAALPGARNGVVIETHRADFSSDLPWSDLDGIVMANALHFLQDQARFLERAATALGEHGTFLIVEYDTYEPNQWVPHPLPCASLGRLLDAIGFPVRSTRTQPSAYQSGVMYSVRARRARS